MKKSEDDEASSSVGGSNKGVSMDDGFDAGLSICSPENDLPAEVKDEDAAEDDTEADADGSPEPPQVPVAAAA